MERDEYAIMFRVEDRHWWYAGLRAMLAHAWARHAPGAGARLLDVGCGTGANLQTLRAHTTGFGIDFSRDALQFCRKRGHVRTAAASATDLPFANASFDAVISCDVLCHRSIGDKSRPLREMRRVLKPGGILILNLPAYQWLHSSHDVHVQTDHRFTATEARGLLVRAGLRPVYTTYWNSLLFPAVALVRLWRKVRPLPASDLDGASGEDAGSLLAGLLRFERAMLRIAPLPFGLSVLVVAVAE